MKKKVFAEGIKFIVFMGFFTACAALWLHFEGFGLERWWTKYLVGLFLFMVARGYAENITGAICRRLGIDENPFHEWVEETQKAAGKVISNSTRNVGCVEKRLGQEVTLTPRLTFILIVVSAKLVIIFSSPWILVKYAEFLSKVMGA